MKYILKVQVSLLFLIFLGCKESKTSKENEVSKENEISKKVQEVYAEPEFVIDGIYGTSTAIPLLNNHSVNVLDGNTKTSWRTLNGAGPKEGIMVYFNKPIYIKKINIIQAEGEGIIKVDQFDVYANGKIYTAGNINSEVAALFIGINEVNSTNLIVNTLKEDNEYGDFLKITNTTFSPNYAVAISEIEFFDNSNNKIDFVIPKLVKASIQSSSTLTPEVAYAASNLFDCKKDFGWAENVTGNGIGESITIETEQPIEYNKIKIWNGYQRSIKHFNANGSVRALSFTNDAIEDKLNNQVLDLENTTIPQAFYINNRMSTNAFELTLKDVYEGRQYEDVLMSEVRLYEKNRPIILLSKEKEEVIKVNRKEKVSNKVLEYVLDRNMKMSFLERKEVEDTFLNKNKETSFTLRSNNSFVMYEKERRGYEGQKEDFTSQTIADGNWELISKNEGEVKVRVFGRIYDVFDGVGSYKGKEKKESTKIFKDVVTITMDSIEGEKFIGQIKMR